MGKFAKLIVVLLDPPVCFIFQHGPFLGNLGNQAKVIVVLLNLPVCSFFLLVQIGPFWASL